MRNRKILVTLTGILMTAAKLFAEDKASKVDALLSEFNRPNTPGAAVMVIRDRKVLFAKGYGLSRLGGIEKQVRCETNTNFRLASVSKQFTAMAVMILVERKKLSLDERLTDVFPEFPAYGEQITIRHLLTHQSGLRDYEDVIPAGTVLPVLDRDVLRLMLQQEKTDFPPGTKYHYSNTAYALLAMIVEMRSGQTFATFLRKNIFKPLGMDNTLAYEQGSSFVPNRAMGHTIRTNGVEQTDQSITSAVLGDGGIYSSVNDLFKWDQALQKLEARSEKLELARGTKDSNFYLVSPDSFQKIFTPHIATDKPQTSYGFGWYIGNYRGAKKIWHSGETCGFTTRIERFPDKKFSVVILTNRRNASPQLTEIVQKLEDLFLFGESASR